MATWLPQTPTLVTSRISPRSKQSYQQKRKGQNHLCISQTSEEVHHHHHNQSQCHALKERRCRASVVFSGVMARMQDFKISDFARYFTLPTYTYKERMY